MASTLEFGVMDGFGDIARYATAAEGYDQHIRDQRHGVGDVAPTTLRRDGWASNRLYPYEFI